ncbi:heparinase II/III family protein [Brucella sp. BE17]|uniref:heparinase II/III domain-containing protein n=1 Tax=Brucella sp. BE17 TaxID=3142977 RepID=UPI0031BA390C
MKEADIYSKIDSFCWLQDHCLWYISHGVWALGVPKMTAYNDDAAYLYRGDPLRFRDIIQSQPLIPYDQLDDFSLTKEDYKSKYTSILEKGWKLQNIVYPLSKNFSWDSYSRSQRYHIHAWDPLSILLPSYEIFSDERALRISIDVARYWLDSFQVQYFQNDIEEGLDAALADESTMAWYDMSVGQRIPRHAFLLDIVARQKGHETLFSDLFRSLIFQLEMLSRDSFWQGHNNHGLYQALGHLAAARRFRFLPGFESYYDLAQQRTDVMLRKQFFPSGIHSEHSPAYHKMVLRSVSGALRSGLIEDPALALMLEHSEDALQWMAAPDNSLTTFGDTDHIQDKMLKGFRPSGLKAYDDAGYVFARKPGPEDASNDSYFAQMAAFHSRTHKHADHLTFIWHDQGRPILIDPGRYGYGPKTVLGDELSMAGFFYSDPERRYVESTRAHNCVEIDAADYKRKGAKPFGSALLFAQQKDNLWLTLCEVRHQSVRHFRSIFVAPGTFLLVVDWLKDGKDEAHDYRQWFQLAPKWTACSTGNILSAENGGHKLSAVNLIPDTVISPVYLGQKEPMQGWNSPRAGELQPTSSFNFAHHGVEARFASLFCLSDTVNVEKASFNGILSKGDISWSTASQHHRLRFSRDGSSLSAELDQTDKSPKRWLSFLRRKTQ